MTKIAVFDEKKFRVGWTSYWTSYDVTESDKLDQYLSTVSTSFTVNRYFSNHILLLGIINCICTPGMKEHIDFFCSCSVLVPGVRICFCSCSVPVLRPKNFFLFPFCSCSRFSFFSLFLFCSCSRF